MVTYPVDGICHGFTALRVRRPQTLYSNPRTCLERVEDPSYRPAQKTTRKTQNRHGKPNSLISMADLAVFCHCDNALLPNHDPAGDIIPNSMINSYVRQLWREKRMHLADFPDHVSVQSG